MKRDPFEIGNARVAPGTRQTVELPVSQLPDHTAVNMSAHVVHGKKPGPVVFISAAIHGDEIVGVEIVRRLLKAKPVSRLSGTLICVPIVNSFGFLNRSRYLPDRRDLNRSFPGMEHGSLASRLADIFMREVVGRSDLGIDLHSAAIPRSNLPQIRLTPDNPRLRTLGEAFAAPVMLPSKLRDGSLRAAAEEVGVDVLLFEGGEGLRFDEFVVRSGVSGILRALHALGMLPKKSIPKARASTLMATDSSWERASIGGLMRAYKGLGDMVSAGESLGMIADPLGESEAEIIAETSGLIIGRTCMPLVNEGDAIFHIAELEASDTEAVREVSAHRDAPALFDEDEII
ncbi:succinylglutamate desuccinylase [Rhodobacteraceae bacterium 63075]|nr:succinylglutamate desuccinylase [Rhodobacteraceae bacterium 63075]